jgi:phage baseplate assembly protein W
MTKAINFPFNFRGNGTLIETEDIAKIYVDRVLTLLSTNTGQRPMAQTYGTDLSEALFENDNKLEAAVKEAVTSSLNRWIPEVVAEEIIVGMPDETGIAEVDIRLRLPNNVTTAVQINTAIFYADGKITQQ